MMNKLVFQLLFYNFDILSRVLAKIVIKLNHK